jgi:hypothetical protein
MIPAELPATWRSRADELRPYAPGAAEAFARAAAELDAAMAEAADAPLTLAEAVAESGYSERRLRELLSEGAIPNAGRKHRPRIRRADLPRKAGAGKAEPSNGYDPDADAAALLARGVG